MNDNHGDIRPGDTEPGDNADDGSGIEPAEESRPVSHPLDMPRKADLTRSDQARRSRQVQAAPGLAGAASKPAAARRAIARGILGALARPTSQAHP